MGTQLVGELTGVGFLTKYDLVDILMEHFPPDALVGQMSGTKHYSAKQAHRMLHGNSRNQEDGGRRIEQLRLHFGDVECIDPFKLRLWLYGQMDEPSHKPATT